MPGSRRRSGRCSEPRFPYRWLCSRSSGQAEVLNRQGFHASTGRIRFTHKETPREGGGLGWVVFGVFCVVRRERSAEVEAVKLTQRPQIGVQCRPHPFLCLLAGYHTRRVVEIFGQVRAPYHLGEEQRPRARNHLVDRISPAPQRQPPAVDRKSVV